MQAFTGFHKNPPFLQFHLAVKGLWQEEGGRGAQAELHKAEDIAYSTDFSPTRFLLVRLNLRAWKFRSRKGAVPITLTLSASQHLSREGTSQRENCAIFFLS